MLEDADHCAYTPQMSPVSFLHRFFSPTERAAASARPKNLAATSLNTVATADVIAGQAALLRRIKMSYGFNERTFATHVFTSIDGLARYLYLIPASSSGIYPNAGGAFRMALEIGLYALHAADGHSFSRQDAGQSRDELRHRWRLASLLSGMFGELHRVFARVEVVNQQGEFWPAGIVPLVDWLNQTSSKRYTVRFRQSPIEARALSVHIASQVIPAEVIKYLFVGDPPVVIQFFSFLGSATPESNPLTDIVRRTASAVLDRNMQESAQMGRALVGHAQATLLDSLRALVVSPDWLPNAPSSKAWYANDGFFIAWPAAAAALVRCSPRLVPTGADAIQHVLHLLQASELITPGDEGPVWRIMAPGMRTPVDAIRLAAPLLAIEGLTRRWTPLAQGIGWPTATEKPQTHSLAARQAPRKQRSETRENPTLQLFQEETPPTPDESATNPPDASMAELPRQLTVGYRTTLNPYVRDALESIVADVETRHELVLARPHAHGLFIATEAWEKCGVDSPVAVRSLFEAGMLHLNSAEPHKRIFSMLMGDDTHSGCIVRPEFLGGWSEWIAAHSHN